MTFMGARSDQGNSLASICRQGGVRRRAQTKQTCDKRTCAFFSADISRKVVVAAVC